MTNELPIIVYLLVGFYVGLLAAQCGLTLKIACSPVTGTFKFIGRMFEKLDEKTKKKEPEPEPEPEEEPINEHRKNKKDPRQSL